MITGLVVLAVLIPAAIWCLRNPAPAPGLRSVLLGHRLDEAQRAADLEALARTVTDDEGKAL